MQTLILKKDKITTEYAIKFYVRVGDPGSFVKWYKIGEVWSFKPVSSFAEATKYKAKSSADFSIYSTLGLQQRSGVTAIVVSA